MLPAHAAARRLQMAMPCVSRLGGRRRAMACSLLGTRRARANAPTQRHDASRAAASSAWAAQPPAALGPRFRRAARNRGCYRAGGAAD